MLALHLFYHFGQFGIILDPLSSLCFEGLFNHEKSFNNCLLTVLVALVPAHAEIKLFGAVTPVANDGAAEFPRSRTHADPYVVPRGT